MAQTINIIGDGNYLVPAMYLITLQELLAEYGISPQCLLDGTGIPLQTLIEPSSSIGHRSLDKAMINALSQIDNSVTFAMEYAQRLTLTRHGALGYAIQSSQNIAEAIALLMEYYPTCIGGASFTFIKNNDYIGLDLTLAEDSVTEQTACFTLLTVLINIDSIGRHLVSHQYPNETYTTTLSITSNTPEHFSTQDLPEYLHIKFNQTCNQVIWPIELMNVSLPMADPNIKDLATEQCQSELAAITQALHNTSTKQSRHLNDIAGIVRLHIRESEGHIPTQQTIADLLFMSERTLKRKLKQAGTSYQHIKTSERLHRAMKLLADDSLTLEHIAENLGYSNAANFSKAFKQWCGLTPSEYKAKQQ